MSVRVELPEGEGKRVINALVGFINDAGRMMLSIGKKLEWDAERIQRSIPVTQTEQDREHELAISELNLRALRTEVEREELVARREKAAVDLADARLRQRTNMVRTQNFNRQVHRKEGNPNGQPRPSMQPNRPQPAAQERRNQLEGNLEGKQSLTQNLGEKLQGAGASKS